MPFAAKCGPRAPLRILALVLEKVPHRLKFFREPLVLFGLAGAGLFGLYAWLNAEDNRVMVDDTLRSRISADWAAQIGRPPTPVELHNLVSQWVEEELHYREAMRLGLQDDDVIVRRRLVQKLRFMAEDEALGPPPPDEALKAWFEQNKIRYTLPGRVSFEHQFFSADSRADAAADALLAKVSETSESDPSMLDSSFNRASHAQIARNFGGSFADDVFVLEKSEAWQGPFASAYGQHLVRIREVIPPQPPGFEAVAQGVKRDFELERKEAAAKAFLAELHQRYEVVGWP